MKFRFLIVPLFLLEASAQPKGTTVDIGGYLEYLITHANTPAYGALTDQLVHGRLNMKWYTSDELTAACEIRARAYDGGSVENTPNFINLIRNDHEFAHLDAVLWTSTSTVGYAEVDRLWADWNRGPLEITIGRQRVAMGTNLVWNPTDLFNPLSILDFDYQERPAFDGAHVQYYLGPLSKLELVVKPGKTSATAATAVAFTTNLWEYDFHTIVARRNNHWVIGESWAGAISGGGFRGEVLVSQKPRLLPSGGYDASQSQGAMVSGAISGDYTLPSSLYLHVESLYNSVGVTQNAALFSQQEMVLGLLSPSRWSLFGEISYDITPLIRGSFYLLQNPTDGSRVLFPSITWSVATNLDLSLIGLLFRGDSLTEFGGFGESAYLRLKFSF